MKHIKITKDDIKKLKHYKSIKSNTGLCGGDVILEPCGDKGWMWVVLNSNTMLCAHEIKLRIVENVCRISFYSDGKEDVAIWGIIYDTKG